MRVKVSLSKPATEATANQNEKNKRSKSADGTCAISETASVRTKPLSAHVALLLQVRVSYGPCPWSGNGVYIYMCIAQDCLPLLLNFDNQR